MELVLGNAVVFGKITEGYDTIAINVELEKAYSAITDIGSRENLLIEGIETATRYTHFETLYCAWGTDIEGCYRFRIPSPVIVGGIYTLTATWIGESKTASYIAQIGDTVQDVKTNLEADIVAKWGAGAIYAGPLDDACYVFPFQTTIWGISLQDPFTGSCLLPSSQIPKPTINPDIIFQALNYMSAYVVKIDFCPKFPVLKYGATHEFGIVYKDEIGRRCSVMRGSDLNVYLPFYGEDPAVLVGTRVAVTFKINHLPPAWAKTYEIVYAGNVSMDYFLQIRINEIYDIDNDRWSINIQDTLDAAREQNQRWKVPNYEWEHGDRIRLIGTIDDATGVVSEYADLYDYEIEETATDYTGKVIGGDWLLVQAVEAPTDFEGERDILAEIYRPRKGLGTTIFYGTGMVFEIGENSQGYKYHKGDIDQDIDANGVMVTPAEVYNTANDCWKYPRISYTHEVAPALWYFWAESNAPSDWWAIQTKLTSQGWPFLYDISQRQHILDERIRHGGYLLEGTQTNNIARFEYNDFVDLPRKNGAITALREIGYTLKALQEYKETSIYLNRIQTFSADGGLSDYTLIDRMLGTIRPTEDDYGCQHPDSVMVNDRYLYYWDNSEGKYIRSAPNGLKAISDYKMKRWFKNLSSWIAQSGGSSELVVNSGFNVDHNEVWVTWRLRGVVWGAIFSESHGRWISRIDQKTESYVHLGKWFAHLYNQKLYIMNIDEGQNWLEWAGTPTVGEVQFVSNIYPEKNKVFNSLAVYADHQLECNSRYIIIPYEASDALKETLVAVWSKTEGVYYGRILKDQNSPGSFPTENHRTMNGREMRGRYCYVRLRTEEHDEKVRIYSVIVISTNSERSA